MTPNGMRLVTATAVAAGLALSAGAATAQGLFGGGSFYIKGFGGATWPQDDDFQVNDRLGGGSFDGGLNYDTGYVLGVAAGWAGIGAASSCARRASSAAIRAS